MIIPNCEKAIISEEKIFGYCLNPEHPVGKYKAKVFDSLLNINQNNGYILIEALSNAVKTGNALFEKETEHGRYFLLDFNLKNNKKSCLIRSA